MILPTYNSKRYVMLPSSVRLSACRENDNAALFLSILTLRSATLPNSRRLDWINIHSDLLQKIVGHNYRQTIDDLIQAEVIQCNENYSTGQNGNRGFTKSYRFHPKTNLKRTRLHEIIGAWAKQRIEPSQLPDSSNLKLAGMHYFNSLSRFALDLSGCHNKRLLTSQAYAVERFASGRHYAVRCRYGRLHSTLTAIPRRVRHLLRIDDDSDLTVLDVRSCQPLLLGHLFRTKNLPTFDGYRSGLCVRVTCDDDDGWLDQCQSGKLVETLRAFVRDMPGDVIARYSDRYGHERTSNLKTCSDRVFKQNILVPFFHRQEVTERHPVFEIIARHYPGIAEIVRTVKQDDHRCLARLLQSMESSLMIDALGERLAKFAPNEPIGTIHDAIVCKTAFAQMAEEHLIAVFQEIGLNPSVKKERLSISK